MDPLTDRALQHLASALPDRDTAWLRPLLAWFGRHSLHLARVEQPGPVLVLANDCERFALPWDVVLILGEELRSGKRIDWAGMEAWRRR